MEKVYGIHAVEAVLSNRPSAIQQVWLGDSRSGQEALIQRLQSLPVNVQTLKREELDRLSKSGNHQGFIIECEPANPYPEGFVAERLSELTAADITPLLLILDQVQDPHNLGAILRTADAAGVHMVIAPKKQSAGLNNTVRKIACGASETVPFVQVTNLARAMRALQEQGVWLVGAAGEAEQLVYQQSLTGPIALVMGAEGTGLRRLTREHCDQLIKLPMLGAVSSLNVSVATGVALYEILRQRMLVE